MHDADDNVPFGAYITSECVLQLCKDIPDLIHCSLETLFTVNEPCHHQCDQCPQFFLFSAGLARHRKTHGNRKKTSKRMSLNNPIECYFIKHTCSSVPAVSRTATSKVNEQSKSCNEYAASSIN